MNYQNYPDKFESMETDQEELVNKIKHSQKYTITTKEASVWSGIGINRLRDIMNDPDCPFVLRVGNRKLVKKEIFKNWLDMQWSV